MKKNFTNCLLFFGNLIFVSLILFISSCQVDTAQNVNSNCAQTDVGATSMLLPNNVDNTSKSITVKLYSGGYYIVNNPLFGGKEYASNKLTFENNLSVDVTYEVYDSETGSEKMIASGTTENLKVAIGEASAKQLTVYTFDVAAGAKISYKITEIKVTSDDGCPMSKNDTTIVGKNVKVSESVDGTTPIVRVGAVESASITSSSFVISRDTVYTKNADLSEYGIAYANSTTPDDIVSVPSINGVPLSSTSGSALSFSAAVTNLSPNVKYVVRAYAIQKNIVYYSPDSIEVTTNAVALPTVTVGEVKDITSTSLTVAGNTVMGGELSEFGVAYSLTNNTNDITKYIASTGNASGYDVNISGLTANTTYYVWAYAIQNGVYIYSATSVQAIPSAPVYTITYLGVEYEIDNSDYVFYNNPIDGIYYMTINLYKHNSQNEEEFKLALELHSTSGYTPGTYTFGTGSSELTFNNSTKIFIKDNNNNNEATGGESIVLTVTDNGDYMLEMNFTTDYGTLTGTYVVPAANGYIQ